MATTTTCECVYCNGGTVWGGVYAPRIQCLICKGTNRMTDERFVGTTATEGEAR